MGGRLTGGTRASWGWVGSPKIVSMVLKNDNMAGIYVRLASNILPLELVEREGATSRGRARFFG